MLKTLDISYQSMTYWSTIMTKLELFKNECNNGLLEREVYTQKTVELINYVREMFSDAYYELDVSELCNIVINYLN